MADYDGSIRINTKIDTKDASSQLLSLWNQMQKTADKIASLRSKMDALKDVKIPTEEYKSIQSDIAKAEKELEKLLEKQAQMQREGKTSGSAWDLLVQKIQASKDYIDAAKSELQGLVDTGKAFTIGKDTAEYSKLGQQLGYEESNLQRLNKRYEEMQEKQGGVVGSFDRMKQAAQKALSAIAAGFAKIGSIGKKAFSGIASIAKRAFSALTGGAKQSNNSFSSGLKTMLKYGLGIRSIYALVNKFRAAVKEGFTNLAQASEPVNNSISMVMSALAQLKNSLATAFAPILSVVAPALTSLINLLSQAATQVGMLIAALTGAASFTKAVAVQKDYAKSLAGTAGAAKKAAGALAAFDDINVLQINKNDGGGAGATSPAEMFEEVKMPDKFQNIADMFKKMWESADFTGLGAFIGQQLKDALDGIDWNPIQETAQRIGKSLATLLNGFVTVDGLAESIGKTVGEAINTGIKGINAFLDNTNWAAVGQFIGNGFNGLVGTVDWKGLGHLFAQKLNAVFITLANAIKTFDWTALGSSLSEGLVTFISDLDTSAIGETISEAVKGLLDMIIEFFENTDWQALGETVATKVVEFVTAIDWNGIADRLFEGIGAALGGLSAFLIGLLKDAWAAVVKWWHDTAYKDGQFTIDGLLSGIGEALSNIGTWIVEHIFNPFIEGFKKAFGIASPSKVMEEMGVYIMQGLLDGIMSLVDMVTQTWENMKETAIEIWEGFKQTLDDIWGGIKLMFEGVIQFLTGVFTGDWEKAWGGVTKIFEGVKETLKGIINGILGGVETMANGVVKAINTIIRALNGLKFDMPDWLPFGLGGKKFSLNINELSEVKIPRLATGAVIRGGNPFIAMLGDQPRGQTNIEAPLATIEQAVDNVMARNGYGKGENVPVNININYDGETFARLSLDNIMAEAARRNYNVELLGWT